MGQEVNLDTLKKMSSIRYHYEKYGIENFYALGIYENPHRLIVQRLAAQRCSHYESVLDLACGNGEVTEALPAHVRVIGVDPYLHEEYRRRTNRKTFSYSFDDIAFKQPLEILEQS